MARDAHKIIDILKEKFPRLESAVIEFRRYLGPIKKRRFENAWMKYQNDYCEYVPLAGRSWDKLGNITDNKKHKLPHFHASYGDDDAVFSIADGEVIEGNMAKNKLKLVQAWIEIHREDLMTDWRLAVSGQNPMPIKPLE